MIIPMNIPKIMQTAIGGHFLKTMFMILIEFEMSSSTVNNTEPGSSATRTKANFFENELISFLA